MVFTQLFAFSCSESNILLDPEKTLNILLKPRPLPGHIQGVYVQNILKLFTRIVTGLLEQNNTNQIASLCDLLLKKLPAFISSGHIEVQERASSAFVLIQMLKEQLQINGIICIETNSGDDMLVINDIEKNSVNIERPKSGSIPIEAIDIVHEMAVLFAGDLNPVAQKAQRKVPLPEGLDLDEWINPPPAADSSSSSDAEQTDLFVSNDNGDEHGQRSRHVELTSEELEQANITFSLITFNKS